MSGFIDILSAILIAVGAFFALIGGVGLLRLPDFYTRIHAAGVTDTLGAGLVLLGLLLRTPDVLVAFKLLTILVFLLVTSPTSAHALSKSALTHGLEPLLDPEEDGAP